MTKFTYQIGGGQFTFKFPGKPPANVLTCLKGHGFRWSPGRGEWWRQRIAGAADVVAAIDRLLNPGRPDGACWKCQSPYGRFRNRGAAAPVWCDKCHQEVLAAEMADAEKRQTEYRARIAADDFDLANNRSM